MRSAETGPAVPDVAEMAEELLSDAAWEALPLSTRAACQLSGILMLLDWVSEDIHSEEGKHLLWAAEHVQRVSHEVHQMLRKLVV